MLNRFKLRNFDSHLDNYVVPRVKLDYTKSDTLYDNNKGISHYILTDPVSGNHRIVSDVEICMSDSPDITSLFPREYRNALHNKLANQPHSPLPSSGVSDDDLERLVTPQSLELDERVNLVKSRSKSFFGSATEKVIDALSHSKSVSFEDVSKSSSDSPESKID